jgi:hypothetical protein
MSNEPKELDEFQEKYGDLITRADNLGIDDAGIKFIGNLIAVLESELDDDAAKTVIDSALKLSEK